MVVTKQAPDEDLWKTVQETPWLDRERSYVVNAPQRPAISNRQATLIAADATLPPNHYAREANLVRVTPSVIQSFAAGFIAEQLKRTNPAHGRSQ